MPSFGKVVSDFLRPYQYYIIAALAIILFSVIAYYIYQNTYKNKRKNAKFEDVANANN